jgi:hypothetical protein
VTARFGTDGGRRAAAFDRPLFKPTIMELSTLAMTVGVHLAIDSAWRISGVAAETLDRALDDCRYISPPTSRFGHNSMAAARTLLQFSGRCEGCARTVDLAGSDACGELFAHTVDPYGQPVDADLRSGAVDWPAAICRGCRERMHADGFTRFVDFKFAGHPPCPQCGARRTRENFYGEPSEPWNIRPWQNAAGCCRRPQEWLCGVCDHQW